MTMIIERPQFFRKDEENIIKISRAAVKAIPMVSAHPYFKKTRNWKHIAFHYASTPPNQMEVVLFNGQLSEPTANLQVSPMAYINFNIDAIVLHDFDNGWLTIPREALPTEDLDLIFDSRFRQPNTTVSLQNKSNAILTWTAAEDTDSTTQYAVFKKIETGAYSKIATVIGTRTYTDAGLAPDMVFTYKVEIEDLEKYIPATDQETVTTARPLPPNNLILSTTPGQITLTWQPVAGSNMTYRVYRSNNSGTYTTALISGLTNTTYTDNTVQGGLIYYYVVRAFDGFESFNSNEVIGKPMGLFSITSFQPVNATNASISWSTAAGSTSYVLNFKTSGASAYTSIQAVSPFIISNLIEGETYQAYIFASNDMTSVQSAIETTTMPYTPAVPTNLTAESWHSGHVPLTWNEAQYADKYRVYRSTNVNGPFTQILETISLAHDDLSLQNGATYYYKVSAVNIHGNLVIESAQSSSVIGEPNQVTSSVAAGLSNITSSNCSVTWSGYTNAPSWLISKIELLWYNKTAVEQGKITTVAGATITSSAAQTLALNTEFSAYVLIYTTRGAVIRSYLLQYRTPANSPFNLTATANNSAITLNWSAGVGNTYYYVYRSTSQFGGQFLKQNNTTSTTDLPETDVKQYYSVIGFNGSAWSGTNPSGTTQVQFIHNQSLASNIVEATRPSLPAVPSVTSLLTPASTTAQVFWNINDIKGASYIKVFRVVSDTYPTSQEFNSYVFTTEVGHIATPDNIGNWTDTSVVNGKYCFYKIRYMRNDAQLSQLSNSMFISPMAAAVGDVTIANIRTTAVNVNWPAVAGASRYVVTSKRMDTLASTLTYTPEAIAPVTSIDVTNLVKDVQYEFSVKATVVRQLQGYTAQSGPSERLFPTPVLETPREIPVYQGSSGSVAKRRFRTVSGPIITDVNDTFTYDLPDPIKTYKIMFRSVSLSGGTTNNAGSATHRAVVVSYPSTGGSSSQSLYITQPLPNLTINENGSRDFYLIVSGLTKIFIYGDVPEPSNIAYHSSYVTMSWGNFELYEV